MASIEKIRKKKGSKVVEPSKGGVKGKDGGGESSEQRSQPGSLISVKEAASSDQHDTIETSRGREQYKSPTPETSSLPSSSRVGPERPSSTIQLSPGPAMANSRPGSALSQRSQNHPAMSPFGSLTSVKSREAWVEESPSRPSSVVSRNSKTSMVPAEMNESHAYVPYLYARDCIAKITMDMKNMKSNHIRIVHDIEHNYISIEDETQAQFNLFVVSLREQYGMKVKTFRQVIEVHRLELQQKEEYWDEALISLSSRNKQLLQDKKVLLIQNKAEFEQLEKEKTEAVKSLTATLDEKNAKLAEMKNEMELQHSEETKVIRDALEHEKDDNEKLRGEIENLRHKLHFTGGSAVVASVQSSMKSDPDIVVADMSEEDRLHMEEERKRMKTERDTIMEDRKMMEEERGLFADERHRFQEEHILLQGDLANAIKGQEEWKFKYNDLKGQLGDLAELKAKYEALSAQFMAVSAMAAVTSTDDQKKADEKIAKAAADRDLMLEEQHQMEEDIRKWEAEFRERNGCDPEPKDRPDSIQELVVSKQEADAMVSSLNTQISTIETLKDGKVPAAPAVVATPIEIQEQEVKTIEVKVPDPEILHQLQASQAEVDLLKTAVSASKDESTYQQAQVSNLESEISGAKAEIAKLEAKLAALEKTKQLAADAATGSTDDRDLRYKVKEQGEKIHMMEKERRALERDLKKMMKSHAEQDGAQAKRLLEIVVKEVHAVHGKAEKAASLVRERLASQTADKVKVIQEQENVTKQYNSWVSRWHKEHSAAPSQEEREADTEGRRLFSELEAATTRANDHALTLQALEMISTGVVKEDITPKPQEKAIPVAVGGSAAAVNIDELEILRRENETLEERLEDIETEKHDLDVKNQELEHELQELKNRLTTEEGLEGYATLITPSSDDVEDLNRQISDLQNQVDEGEARLSEERSAHDMTREELEAIQAQVLALRTELELLQVSSKADLDAASGKLTAEIANLKLKLSTAEARAEELDKLRLANIPVDTQREIQSLKAKLAEAQQTADLQVTTRAALEADIKQLTAKLATTVKASSSQKAASSDSQIKLKQLRAEKEKEIKELIAKYDKREKDRVKQEEKKISALERKIQQQEAVAAAGGGAAGVAAAAKGTVAVKSGPDKAMQEKLREGARELKEAQAKVKFLEGELKKAQKEAGGSSVEADREKKKQEKILKELEKKLEMISKKNEKNEQNLKKREEELDLVTKDNTTKDKEIGSLKQELALLGASAAEGLEAAAKVSSLEAEVKKLTEENKTLATNYNSERVLRKKYYNMVEDMKGKIRVYCRVRPLSSSEKGRGNFSVCKSPDEYTISLDGNRGLKEFQFDSVFMPEHTQDKVFEDTNNLIQSAVDGYNVCIFAYGQTGSGKTYTIIGDSSGTSPGIAPRAFHRIFELLEENKSKFSYKVQVYMLELYNDKLLDLFSKAGAAQEEKMDIKKDKKGMVVVQGAEVKAAKNPKELMSLFEEGSKNRHTASTKMNAESSRSHLVVGITIETTNKVSGQVTKGKLSLVDLAGSERAAKTGASAEQLKEAMSINKSLSALGDVISALSSEQSYIPYRNNKLPMLMQDSLGGNAKTLMFVNISPADYNVDESVISLTYASRVKLITNDASKNADNKEIARLKNVIAKLKQGEAVEDEALEEPGESQA